MRWLLAAFHLSLLYSCISSSTRLWLKDLVNIWNTGMWNGTPCWDYRDLFLMSVPWVRSHLLDTTSVKYTSLLHIYTSFLHIFDLHTIFFISGECCTQICHILTALCSIHWLPLHNISSLCPKQDVSAFKNLWLWAIWSLGFSLGWRLKWPSSEIYYCCDGLFHCSGEQSKGPNKSACKGMISVYNKTVMNCAEIWYLGINDAELCATVCTCSSLWNSQQLLFLQASDNSW